MEIEERGRKEEESMEAAMATLYYVYGEDDLLITLFYRRRNCNALCDCGREAFHIEK